MLTGEPHPAAPEVPMAKIGARNQLTAKVTQIVKAVSVLLMKD